MNFLRRKTRKKFTAVIDGVECDTCIGNIHEIVGMLDGVHKFHVDIRDARCTAEYDPTQISKRTIQEEIESVGYRLTVL